MSDTPRTDDQIGHGGSTMTFVRICFARQLERELNAAKAALSGRTVSCSNCNALADENAEMRATIQRIYDMTECCADGAPDASAHDKLCNELAHTLKPFLK